MPKTNISRCFLLLAVTVFLSLFGSEARADQIGYIGSASDPCLTILGAKSPVTLKGCKIVNNLGEPTYIGPTVDTGVATPDSFLVTMSPVYVNTPKGNSAPAPWTNSAAGAGTATSSSYLELDGFINLFTAGSSVTLTLTGDEAGTPLDAITEIFTPAGYWIFTTGNGTRNGFYPVSNCTSTPCGETVSVYTDGPGATNPPGGPFTETLTVAITSGGRFVSPGSADFGGVPEPATLTLLATGLLALMSIHRGKTA